MLKIKAYLILVLLLAAMACTKEAIDSFKGWVTPSHFPPPAYPLAQNKITSAGFDLGKMLFFDSTLSVDNFMSCGSCHDQASAFTHHEHDLSHGRNGALTKRNTPPIMNLAWSTSFMWDGGIRHLDRQPIMPLTNPIEMGTTIPSVLSKLNASSMYRSMFAEAFGSPVATEEKMLQALSQFMLMCVSAEAKYDSVKRGQARFTDDETAGYEIFKQQCNSCHTEPLFTDQSFRNNGVAPNYLMDSGRFVVTKNPADLYKFKVPSLRNLSYTLPYMHDGRIHTLGGIFEHYANGVTDLPTLDPLLRQGNRRGIALNSEERRKLTAFLKTLDDKNFVTNKTFDRHIQH